MRLKNKDLASFPKTVPPSADIAVIYGPDQGLVRERAESLTRAIVEDPKDPFRVLDLSESEYRSDPVRLIDEFGALAMLGGRRVIRLRLTGERASASLKTFISELDQGSIAGDAMVVIEAGELPPSSSLRKAAESTKRAVAVPCYIDDERTLASYIRQTLDLEGLKASNEIVSALADQLGNDRGVTKQELEKVVLYKRGSHASGGDTVIEDDIDAVVAEATVRDIEDACYAAGLGQLSKIESSLDRCFLDGAQPASVVRALQRHIEKLYAALMAIDSGMTVREAIQGLRPRIHFKRAPAFEQQLKNWNRAKCRRALSSLFEDEIACKTTGSPAEIICRRGTLRVSQLARQS